LLFMSLLGNLFFPWGVGRVAGPGAIVVSLVAVAVKIGVLTAVLAVVETSVAKLRLFRVPELLAGSFALAVLSIASVFLVR
jgi:formate hydrogenlyase subunit 4